MPKQEDIARGTATVKPRKQYQPSKQGLISFKLAKDDVSYLSVIHLDGSKSLAILDEFLERGVKYTIGAPLDRPGRYIVLRDGSKSFGEGVGVSCWASSIENALITAAFYLTQVNPSFPEIPQGAYQTTFDF